MRETEKQGDRGRQKFVRMDRPKRGEEKVRKCEWSLKKKKKVEKQWL